MAKTSCPAFSLAGRRRARKPRFLWASLYTRWPRTPSDPYRGHPASALVPSVSQPIAPLRGGRFVVAGRSRAPVETPCHDPGSRTRGWTLPNNVTPLCLRPSRPNESWPGTIRACSSLATFLLFQRSTETIRLRARLDDVGLVGQPVQHRLTQSCVRKHRGPLGERQIRCDDHRGSFRSSCNDLEQQLSRCFGHRYISHLVNHDQLVPHPPIRHAIQFALI